MYLFTVLKYLLLLVKERPIIDRLLSQMVIHTCINLISLLLLAAASGHARASLYVLGRGFDRRQEFLPRTIRLTTVRLHGPVERLVRVVDHVNAWFGVVAAAEILRVDRVYGRSG